jgi:hypothetical protein
VNEERRPVAADFMILEEDLFVEELDMDEHVRLLDINRLRLYINNAYEMEEGEVLAAFDSISDDRQLVCDLVVSYIRSLDDFKNMRNIDIISDFVIDVAEELNLDSAEALAVHAVIIGDAIISE